MIRSLFIILLCCTFALLSRAQDTAPQSPETITLPLPDGQSIEFSLIRVAETDNLFSSADFNIGESLKSTYGQRLTPTSVSGTVYVAPSSGKTGYWALPMAVTELTRGQYAAIVSPGSPPPEEEADLPVTSLSFNEIQTFIDKLNEWWHKDTQAATALDKLGSRQKHGCPYARLPMETEWEYAARGGGHVSGDIFNRTQPYADKTALSKSENLYSQSAELSEVASTGVCNPCGLYDMLGNVREIVQGAFRPEYHFGRIGGLVIRGGCYVDRPTAVFSYTRREQEPYDAKTGEAFRDTCTGFRLVLGSTILTNKISLSTLDDQWSTYWADRASKRPGSSPTDSIQQAIMPNQGDIAQQLGDLASKMTALTGKKSGAVAADVQALGNTLNEMKEQMRMMENIIRKSQVTSAQAALQMIYYSSADAAKNSLAAAQVRERANLSDLSDDIRQALLTNLHTLEANVPTYWSMYTKGCEALKDVDPKVVEEQVNARLQEMKAACAADPAKKSQIPIFELAVLHFKKYVNSGRLSRDECDAWYNDLFKLATQAR